MAWHGVCKGAGFSGDGLYSGRGYDSSFVGSCSVALAMPRGTWLPAVSYSPALTIGHTGLVPTRSSEDTGGVIVWYTVRIETCPMVFQRRVSFQSYLTGITGVDGSLLTLGCRNAGVAGERVHSGRGCV